MKLFHRNNHLPLVITTNCVVISMEFYSLQGLKVMGNSCFGVIVYVRRCLRRDVFVGVYALFRGCVCIRDAGGLVCMQCAED